MITNLLGLPGPGSIRVEWNTTNTNSACQVIVVDGATEWEKRMHMIVPGPSAQVESFEGLDRHHQYTIVIQDPDETKDLNITTD
ncbi:MAG: hypothetical protein J2P17_07425 [Mycobacterium sp.]|nr:hypothetical protein [Mycobacterium sp.]